MGEASTNARKGAFLSSILAGAVLLWGCADLALEADRIPKEMTLSPDTGMLTVGEPTKLRFTVRDQNGEVMPVPGWARPRWRVSDTVVAGISRDGTLTGKWGGRVVVTARFANMITHARFRMNPKEILLTAPVIYLNQSRRTGAEPYLSSRAGLRSSESSWWQIRPTGWSPPRFGSLCCRTTTWSSSGSSLRWATFPIPSMSRAWGGLSTQKFRGP